jgi:HTH-type transcriptional regulator/antitoxin HigA
MLNMTKLIVQLSKTEYMEITKQQYEYALNRIEELLPLVTDETPVSDKNAVELTIVSDVVEAYEKIHYPIAKPTIGELISLSIEEKGITQKQLAEELGISPSRVSDYISGRAEPTLRIARAICLILGIAPAAMLGI